MRAANYSSMNIFNETQVKEINKVIKSNFVEGKDDFAADSHKTSDVKFVYLGKIQQYISLYIVHYFHLHPAECTEYVRKIHWSFRNFLQCNHGCYNKTKATIYHRF